ncbi:MAG: alpha/beta hydrolase [Chloroflexi bacterium]|nr:alpha/beta hydrolase [Chloroflexota bacterium]
MATKTIVFIHGAFVTKHSWTPWVERYQAQGYNAMALAGPGRDKPVKTLKQAHPDPQLGELSLKDVIDHFVSAVQALDEKPALIGHSLGGLLTQSLKLRTSGLFDISHNRLIIIW